MIVLPLKVVIDVTSVTFGALDDCASAEELFQSNKYAARRALSILEVRLTMFTRITGEYWGLYWVGWVVQTLAAIHFILYTAKHHVFQALESAWSIVLGRGVQLRYGVLARHSHFEHSHDLRLLS